MDREEIRQAEWTFDGNIVRVPADLEDALAEWDIYGRIEGDQLVLSKVQHVCGFLWLVSDED